jgi:GTP cyclohydrolase IA
MEKGILMVTPTKMFQARQQLEEAFKAVYDVPQIKDESMLEHTEKTPHRSAHAVFEMFAGCFQDPVGILDATFDNKKYDELIYENDISFVSMCMHHTMPFFGKAHFAYLPAEKIVGLSKIPRLVECYAKRPQIQEQLAIAVVDTFTEVVKPHGCGIVIEAWHFCVSVRGANQRPAYTKTTALRGSFKTNEQLRQEFLNGIRKTSESLWP